MSMGNFYKNNKIIGMLAGSKTNIKKGFRNAEICVVGGDILAGGESAVHTASKKLAALTPEEVKALKTGESYLTLDVELIDSSCPTYNNFWYKEAAMDESFEHELLKRKLNNGGMPCEANHPIDRSDLVRFEYVDMNNITHYITKIWKTGQKYYCTIVTKAMNDNPIVLDILQGRVPAFSIRGLIHGHREGDTLVVDKYQFVSLDYVSVQANLGSSSILDMKCTDLLGNEKAVAYKPIGQELAKAAGESGRAFFNEVGGTVYEIKLAGGESGYVVTVPTEVPHTASDVLSMVTLF